MGMLPVPLLNSQAKKLQTGFNILFKGPFKNRAAYPFTLST